MHCPQSLLMSGSILTNHTDGQAIQHPGTWLVTWDQLVTWDHTAEQLFLTMSAQLGGGPAYGGAERGTKVPIWVSPSSHPPGGQ